MRRRSPRDSPEPHRPPEPRKTADVGRSVVIEGSNEGIASFGSYTRNVQFRVEGEFVYQITRLPQRGANRHHEPWHEQPSQLLLAHHQVVPFTGREGVLVELQAWRDDPASPQTAVRLLHGPGGQGKTRLALQLAAGTPRDWRVWQAATRAARPVVGAGGWKPRSLGRRALIVVDYAER